MTPTEQDKELEICENCGEKCGASLPYGLDCNTELRRAIRKLTTSKVQNVSDAKYGFWHHLDASSLDKIMQLIIADRKRVALEARIDELRAIYGWSQEERTPLIFYPEHRSSDFAQMAANGMGTNFTVRERIAELEQNLLKALETRE